MALPAVNITVADGGLGTVPPSTANIHVKLGVCSKGVNPAAASKLIPSTTGGDGVTFTARAAGAAGNLISFTYNTPAGGSTTVSVNGSAITVSPKAGETNTGLLAAVAANSTANALVSGVVTVGGDLIVAVAQTFLVGGVTGTVNTLFSETSPAGAQTDLGQGPLAEAAVHSLQVAGGQVYCMPLNPSVAGTVSAVTHVGSGGTGVLTVTGTPVDSYSVVMQPTTTGLPGAGAFKYSLDGGLTFSAIYAIPSGGTFALGSTGMTLNFSAASFNTADVYTFSSTAPGFALADVQSAMAVLTALPFQWSFVHVVGAASSVAGAASMAAGLDVLMTSAANAFRYVFAVCEVPVDTDANIAAAFLGFSSNRTMVCPGTDVLLSGITGAQVARSAAWNATARMAKARISEDLGRVASGSLPGVVSLVRDEAATPGLDALNFTTLCTIQGLPGFYITTGHMFAQPGSDYTLVQNRRVMDVACGTARPAFLQFLNDTIRVNKTSGTILEADAQKIERQVNAKLRSVLVAPGDAVDSSVVIDRTTNVLATKTLNVAIKVIPNGYAKTINATISFLNPALQPQ